MFWENVLGPEERTRMIENIANSLKLAVDFIQVRALNLQIFSESLCINIHD